MLGFEPESGCWVRPLGRAGHSSEPQSSASVLAQGSVGGQFSDTRSSRLLTPRGHDDGTVGVCCTTLAHCALPPHPLFWVGLVTPLGGQGWWEPEP